jgi:hypothetical protein
MAGSRDPAGKPPRPDDPFIPTWLQPLPQPEVKEGGESIWDLWHEAVRELDEAFQPTQPSDSVPLAVDARDEARQAPAQRGALTVDELVAQARRHNRACPQQAQWLRLYHELGGSHATDLPPPPIEFWRKLSGLQKRLFFREYLEWADRRGRLAVLARFMDSLSEADWLHIGEA